MKSVNPPSLGGVIKKVSIKPLSELADSQSVKPEEGEVMNHGSIAGEPHLNLGDLKRAERLQRYARLRPCFVDDVENLITSKGQMIQLSIIRQNW